MSNEVKSENADSQKVPAINTNITPEAFAAQRAEAKVAASQPEPKPKKLEPQEVEAEVTDDMEGSEAEVETPVYTEVTEDEQSEEAESEDVHSKEIDLDDIESLSIEDLDALKKKLGGKGTLARFAELTSKRKQAEERLTAIEAKLNDNRPKEDPLAVKKEEKNPYADINTIEDLRDKAREIDDAIEWEEEVLDSNEDAGSDDSVAVIDNCRTIYAICMDGDTISGKHEIGNTVCIGVIEVREDVISGRCNRGSIHKIIALSHRYHSQLTGIDKRHEATPSHKVESAQEKTEGGEYVLFFIAVILFLAGSR